MTRLHIAVALALLSIGSAGRAESPVPGAVVVERAWSRAAVGTGATGVVYMVVRNNGAAGDRLLSARTSIARRVEMHETRSEPDGMTTMTSVATVAVPAHGQVDFAPNGLHAMLVDLHGPLNAGQHFTLDLTFERAGIVPVVVSVEKAGARVFDDMGDMKM